MMELRKCISAAIAVITLFTAMSVSATDYGTFDPDDEYKYNKRYSDGHFEFYLRGNDDNFGISGYLGGLEDVVIPAEFEGIPVVCIADYSFRNARNIRYVGVPGSVKLIGADSFPGCVRLKNITLCEGVKRIARNAFYNCESLESVILPRSLTDLTPSAFDGCTNLKELIFLNPDTFIDSIYVSSFVGIIYGWSGSTAETYAYKYAYPFIALNGLVDDNATSLLTPPETYNSEVTAEDRKYDINCDSATTIADAIVLAKFLAEDITINKDFIGYIYRLADADGDNEYTIADLQIILGYLSK